MIVKQFGSTLIAPLAESLFASLTGFLVSSFVLAILGYNPVMTFIYLFYGSFGSAQNIADTLSNAAPLMLTAITFALGVRAGLFNIGSEGQVYIGAAAAVAASFILLPAGLHLIFSLLLAALAGAIYSIPVYILKVSRGVNEVISTIMLNWISFYATLFISINYLVDPNRNEKTISVLPSARFPVIIPGTDLTAALIFAIIFSISIYFYLWLTPSGYELRAIGLNPRAARFAGINPRRPLFYALSLGGAASGLAGAIQVTGRSTPYALYTTLTNVLNYGFNGIGVALIGRNHPLAIIPAAIFFGALQAGGAAVQLYAQVPFEIVQVVEGIIIFALAAPELYRRIKVAIKR